MHKGSIFILAVKKNFNIHNENDVKFSHFSIDSYKT